MSLYKCGCCNMLFKIILPEVIQIIPAIEAESQGVFLKTQSTEKFPYSFWCALEDRHLHRNKEGRLFFLFLFFTENQSHLLKTVLASSILPLSPSCSLYLHACKGHFYNQASGLVWIGLSALWGRSQPR